MKKVALLQILIWVATVGIASADGLTEQLLNREFSNRYRLIVCGLEKDLSDPDLVGMTSGDLLIIEKPSQDSKEIQISLKTWGLGGNVWNIAPQSIDVGSQGKEMTVKIQGTTPTVSGPRAVEILMRLVDDGQPVISGIASVSLFDRNGLICKGLNPNKWR